MLRSRFSATPTEDTSSNMKSTDMANTYSPSKLEIFLDRTITGTSLFIAVSVYIYLFAIATMVCLVPSREYYSSSSIANYGDSSPGTNKNINIAALPLIEMIFSHSNSQFLRGAKTRLNPLQPQHRSTSLGGSKNNSRSGSKSATAYDGAGGTIATPMNKTPTEHIGDDANDIVEKANFAPSKQLIDAQYSWFTNQDQQALGLHKV